jgi:endonuclease/exonuclease/phosphatase (EEP) superfamily protein YafD
MPPSIARQQWIGIVAVSGVILAACRNAPPPPVTRDTGTTHAAGDARTSVRVMTYNVYVNNRDPAGTAGRIRDVDADIVVMQETTPAVEAALRATLGDRYPHMEFHVGPLGNGPGIVSKLPWTSATYVPSSLGMNGYWIGRIDLGGRSLQLVNVHLHPSLINGWNPLRAQRAYDDAEGVRVAQVDELRAHLDAAIPAVLIGDFNSLPDSRTLARLDELGWANGLAGTPAATAPTYRIHGLGFHIDHVLVPRDLVCTASRVLEGGTSDHDAIVATVAWAPR